MAKRACFWVVATLVVTGCLRPESSILPDLHVTDLSLAQTGAMAYPSRDVAGFDDLMHGAKTVNAETVGTLSLPDTIADGTKVPVMVILHGSGGEWSGRGADHAAWLTQNGIGAFVVDTFTGRGLTRKDKYLSRLAQANMADQLTDAFAALDILATHPNVDGYRIGVMGYSMGGISTLLAAQTQIAKAASSSGRRFALHVPFYAPCFVRLEDLRTTGAPIVGFWGEEDAATPRAVCEKLLSDLRRDGAKVEETWYAGAAHSWNSKPPAAFYAGVPNFAPCRFVIGKDGNVVETVSGLTITKDSDVIKAAESCASMGYTIGHHEGVDRQSREDLIAAIRKHLGKD